VPHLRCSKFLLRLFPVLTDWATFCRSSGAPDLSFEPGIAVLSRSTTICGRWLASYDWTSSHLASRLWESRFHPRHQHAKNNSTLAAEALGALRLKRFMGRGPVVRKLRFVSRNAAPEVRETLAQRARPERSEGEALGTRQGENSSAVGAADASDGQCYGLQTFFISAATFLQMARGTSRARRRP
jgi:hypothetical protein